MLLLLVAHSVAVCTKALITLVPMLSAPPSNLQMFSTYRRVNQVRYLATKPLIIKGTTQCECKPMVLIKMVVILDKCGW